MQTQTVTSSTAAQHFGALMQMASGYWVFQALYAASKLGIPDALREGAQTAAQLAVSLDANEAFLYRLMRALGTLGILTEDADKQFHLTPMGKLLQADSPDTMHPLFLMMGEEHYAAWGGLANGVKTGQTPFEAVYGCQCFEYFEKNPQTDATFNQAMTVLVRNKIPALTAAYDFSPFKRIVDVGGGYGQLLAGILERNTKLSGVVYDLPHVVEGATRHFREVGVADRATVESGDFFKTVPAGADAYILSHIIHDWRDELAVKILRNIHQAMSPEGKLLLAETVITKDGPAAMMGTLMDLNMLVMTDGGRERTEEEYRHLLGAAGFRLTRIINFTPTASIIEAVKQ